MCELLTMLILYLKPLYSTILSVFKINVSAGQLSKLYIVVSLITYVILFFKYEKNKFVIRKSTAVSLLICVIFLLGGLITIWRYGYIHTSFLSEYLSFGSASICAILLGNQMAIDHKIAGLGKFIPLFVVMISITTFVSVITGDRVNGLLSASNSIDYQSASYYAAFAFGLNLYYIKYYDHLEHYNWIRIFKPIFYVLPFLQIVATFMAGGRGGTVLLIILMLYFGFHYLKDNKVSLAMCIKILVLCIIALIGILLLLKKSNSVAGLNRLMHFFEKPLDSERSRLHTLAMEGFKNSPLLGNGTGSVFYIFDRYSHNLFYDFLCEYGIIGIFVLIYVGLVRIRNQYRLSRMAEVNSFSTVVFLCAFVFLMFSSYYLSEQMLWFFIGFASVKEKKVNDRNR